MGTRTRLDQVAGIALRRRPSMTLYAGAGLEPGTPPARRRVP
ncbi:MAG TPA: hypothetical protein VGS62_04040 [Streptosporangiaceae bacterium]|nr:hypothetical protein [Streptosporangiaceae bacterium]